MLRYNSSRPIVFLFFQNKKVVKTVPAYKPVPSREASAEEADTSDDAGANAGANHKDPKDLKDSSSVTSNSSKKSHKKATNTGRKSNGSEDPKEPENPVVEPSPAVAVPAAENLKNAEAPAEIKRSTPPASTASETPKPPAVIVKFGKQDNGTYYSKKEEERRDGADVATSNGSSINKGKMKIDGPIGPVDFSGGKQKSALDDAKIIRTSECSVTIDKSKVDSLRLSSEVKATVYSSSPPERKIPQSNIIVATASTAEKIETKKDSPAKILPLSASTSPSTFGKSLKVDTNHSSSASVEVSPVKMSSSSGERSREVTPPTDGASMR